MYTILLQGISDASRANKVQAELNRKKCYVQYFDKVIESQSSLSERERVKEIALKVAPRVETIVIKRYIVPYAKTGKGKSFAHMSGC